MMFPQPRSKPKVGVWATLIFGTVLVIAACGTGAETGQDSTSTEASTETETSTSTEASTKTEAADEGETLYPDVLGVEASQDGDGSWTFNVTLSSPYDSPERYADAWRVVGPDGTVYGERILAHDHASEQPFTRSQSGIVIPDEVTEVTVEGRDQVSGWGGQTMLFALGR